MNNNSLTRLIVAGVITLLLSPLNSTEARQQKNEEYQISAGGAALVGSVIGGAATLTPVGMLVGGVGGYLTELIVADEAPQASEPTGFLSTELKSQQVEKEKQSTVEEAFIRVTVHQRHCFGTEQALREKAEQLVSVSSRFMILSSHELDAEKNTDEAKRLGRLRCFYLME